MASNNRSIVSCITVWELRLWLLFQFGLLIVTLVPNHEAAFRHIQEPAWPIVFNGQTLEPLALSEREERFVEDFPGSIARFRTGENELILRWVTRATRKLHPAADCLKGVGFEVSPLPMNRDMNGMLWNCVSARREAEKLRVCERIEDSDGASSSDVSSWFWSATLKQTRGPWLAYTFISPG